MVLKMLDLYQQAGAGKGRQAYPDPRVRARVTADQGGLPGHSAANGGLGTCRLRAAGHRSYLAPFSVIMASNASTLANSAGRSRLNLLSSNTR